jgi:type VI secretion system secreted protein VgrG
VTPVPRIHGCQTAKVVGKSGEEIWTDQYGRVKVKFHWDQAAAADETSSCWVRVSQGWAGKQWGTFFLPRIGQEVVISFLEGDPDRPIITGCLYNAQQTVPYALPDNQTRSVIKTDSSKGGGGFNEIRFEDKKGEEELFVQAQKDMNVSVLNDQTVTIKNARSVTVQEADDSLKVAKGNRSVEVAGKETYKVTGERTVNITGADLTYSITNDLELTVGGKLTLKVTGDLTLNVTGAVNVQSQGAMSNQSSQNITIKAGMNLTSEAGAAMTNKAGATHNVEAGAILVLKGAMVKIN